MKTKKFDIFYFLSLLFNNLRKPNSENVPVILKVDVHSNSVIIYRESILYVSNEPKEFVHNSAYSV